MSPRGRLVVAVTSTGLIGYIAVGSLLGRVFGDTTYGQLTVFNEVVRLVLDAYVEPVDLGRAMAGARRGLVEALDGESAYLDAGELEAYDSAPRAGDADVGIVLSRRYSFLVVVATRPGSPAERAGVRTGDIIKTIDGRHTRPIGVPVGERLLQGAPGSVVKLALLRAGSDPIELSVVRERLAPARPQGRVLAEGPAYLKVSELPEGAAGEVRSEVQALSRDGAPSLILDLRGAAYGENAEGLKVAELFLDGGVIARRVGKTSPEKLFQADPAQRVWERPLTVLVDSGTAGPAEIVAAALLDAGHDVVGQGTFGKAAEQKLVRMPEGALLLTVAKYQSPEGTDIHGRGVYPSVPVQVAADLGQEDDEGDAQSGEGAGEAPAAPAGDVVLEKAIEILTAGAKKAA
jgi:carboxyl-terminal processing protease